MLAKSDAATVHIDILMARLCQNSSIDAVIRKRYSSRNAGVSRVKMIESSGQLFLCLREVGGRRVLFSESGRPLVLRRVKERAGTRFDSAGAMKVYRANGAHRKNREKEKGSVKRIRPRRARMALISLTHAVHLLPPTSASCPCYPGVVGSRNPDPSTQRVKLAPLDPAAEYGMLVLMWDNQLRAAVDHRLRFATAADRWNDTNIAYPHTITYLRKVWGFAATKAEYVVVLSWLRVGRCTKVKGWYQRLARGLEGIRIPCHTFAMSRALCPQRGIPVHWPRQRSTSIGLRKVVTYAFLRMPHFHTC